MSFIGAVILAVALFMLALIGAWITQNAATDKDVEEERKAWKPLGRAKYG